MASSSKAAAGVFLARLRAVDWDRYFCTLFAPAEAREDLALLYLFNHELARAREVASEPMLALIRLRWWEEVVEGAQRRHEVAGPLGAAIARGAFAANDLASLIEVRRVEAEDDMSDVLTCLAYVRGTAGRLARVAGSRLGAESSAVEDLGTAYGIAGLQRAASFHLKQGRSLLPADRTGLERLNEEALRLLKARPPKHLLAAALPAAFVRRDLRHVAVVAGRGLMDRLSVLAAATTGRF
jgi:phytoene synthase